MQKVQSSTIEEIGYNAKDLIMTVVFKNGATYDYQEVPSHVYEAVMESESVGKALNSEVKGNYEFIKR